MKTKIILLSLLINCSSALTQTQVAEQWAARYNGPGNYYDYPRKICVDGSGNVIVTGYSYQTISDAAITTIKYSPAGAILWIAVYNGPISDGDDEGYGLAVDTSGNVYVSGYIVNASGHYNIITIKYNSAGVQQWAAIPAGIYSSQGADVAVDNSGNVYVTGTVNYTGSNLDYLTIKYNSAGVQQWLLTYDGTGTSGDAPYVIKIDNQQNLIVTGYSYDASNNEDITTVKYNSAGFAEWIQKYNGTGNSADYANGITVDNSNNIYITGESTGAGTSGDCVTIKYSTAGTQQWAARYNGTANKYDEGVSVAADNSGNVYVTGSSNTSDTSSSYLTVKYNSTGVQQWISKYDNGFPHNYHTGYCIAADMFGYVYVTGSSSVANNQNRDFATIKYNPLTGDSLWVKRYNGPANGSEGPTDLKLDVSGNIYVTGYSLGIGTQSDYETIKYIQSPNVPANLTASAISSSRINLNWTDNSNNELRFKIERSTNEGVNWFLRDSTAANITTFSDTGLTSNTIFHYRVYAYNSVGGSSYSNTAFDTTFVPVGITSNNEAPLTFKLYSNHPNPFNPSTKIEFDIPANGKNEKVPTRLIVYDLLGREVTTLVNQPMHPGSYQVEFNGNNLASGIYFYRIDAGEFTDVKKMILIK